MWEQDDKISYNELLSRSKKVGEVMDFLSNSRCIPKFFYKGNNNGVKKYEATISGLYLPSIYGYYSEPMWFSNTNIRSCFNSLIKAVRDIRDCGLIYHEVYSEEVEEGVFRGLYSVRGGGGLIDLLSDGKNHNGMATYLLNKPDIIHDKRSIIGSNKWGSNVQKVPYNYYSLHCVEIGAKKAILYLIDNGNINDFVRKNLKLLYTKVKDLPEHESQMEKYYYPNEDKVDIMTDIVNKKKWD